VLGGGLATIRQFLAAGLVVEMHSAIAPSCWARASGLFGGLSAGSSSYSCLRGDLIGRHRPRPPHPHAGNRASKEDR
jgi:hypothetical protein